MIVGLCMLFSSLNKGSVTASLLLLSSQGTDYEVQVDVGQCSSGRTCGSNELCQTVNLDIKTIASPDGQSTHTYSVM